MIDLIRQLKPLIRREVKDAVPWFTYATVTSISPLRIRIDGEGEPLPTPPSTNIAGLRVGDRVDVRIANGRATITGINGGPSIDIGDIGGGDRSATTGRVHVGTFPGNLSSPGNSTIGLSPASDSLADAFWVSHDGTTLFRVRKDGSVSHLRDTAWTTLVLASGWTVNSGSPAWRIYDDHLEIRGTVNGAITTAWSTICTIPPAGRPSVIKRFTAAVSGTATGMQLTTAGALQVQSASTASWVGMDGISIPLT